MLPAKAGLNCNKSKSCRQPKTQITCGVCMRQVGNPSFSTKSHLFWVKKMLNLLVISTWWIKKLMRILPERTFFCFFVDLLILGDFCLLSRQLCVFCYLAPLFRGARYRHNHTTMCSGNRTLVFSVAPCVFPPKRGLGTHPEICGPSNMDQKYVRQKICGHSTTTWTVKYDG
jgi:hypothetical protein